MKKIIFAVCALMLMATNALAHGGEHFRYTQPAREYQWICEDRLEMIIPGVYITVPDCRNRLVIVPRHGHHNRHYNPGRNHGYSPNRGNHPKWDYDRFEKPFHRR